jgi:cytochrome o ubiquinol oxidase subunit 2
MVSMRRNRPQPHALARCTGALLSTLLSTCASASDGFINPAGPVAAALRDHFVFIVLVMMIVIVPLFIALPWALWRYRIGNKSGNNSGDKPSRYQPEWEFSWSLELLVWGLPVVIVSILGWKLWEQSYQLDPYKPLAATEAPLEVQAVSLDWKWVFIYPEQGIASADELMIVAGRPVRFRLTSGTVMQSFMIPRLGGQIYTMAGMITQLNLLATEPGEFRGLNTQYNGMGFANQKFLARAVTQADFDDWAARTRQSSPPLDQAAWAQLTQSSVLSAPRFFGSVADDFFADFVASFSGSHHHLTADGN